MCGAERGPAVRGGGGLARRSLVRESSTAASKTSNPRSSKCTRAGNNICSKVGRRDRRTKQISANELRHYYGVVPQETILFSGTLYDNLMMANAHATFEQLRSR